MQKKDDKVGNKTDNKEERQRKKGERKRKIEIDSQRKKPSISQKKCLFQQNLFLANLILISRKPVQRIGIGEECVFFASRRPSPKG